MSSRKNIYFKRPFCHHRHHHCHHHYITWNPRQSFVVNWRRKKKKSRVLCITSPFTQRYVLSLPYHNVICIRWCWFTVTVWYSYWHYWWDSMYWNIRNIWILFNFLKFFLKSEKKKLLHATTLKKLRKTNKWISVELKKIYL